MITLNGFVVRSCWLMQPTTGVWTAEIEAECDIIPSVPIGPAVLFVEATPLRCWVVETFSGLWVDRLRVRVIGGISGGWLRDVLPLHFHNDVGVLSSAVVAATGSEIGEAISDPLPVRYGVDYVRAGGPAARVFGDRPWHVDPISGVTTVGARIPALVDWLTFDLLDWDPVTRCATFAGDGVLSPGSLIADPRLGASVWKLGDVCQSWGEGPARSQSWLVPVASETPGGMSLLFRRLIRENVGVLFLQSYRYRVVLQGVDGRLVLQPVDLAGPMPPTLPVSIWYGIPGFAAKLLPGVIVELHFQGGNPALPVVSGFDGSGLPLDVSLTATKIAVGSGGCVSASIEALRVSLGDAMALKPIVLAPELITWAAAVVEVLKTSGIVVPPLPPSVASLKVFGV